MNAAQVTLAAETLKAVLNDFYYKRENNRNFKKALRINLYIIALSRWVQNSDGIVRQPTYNPYSQESLDTMVGYLFANCKEIVVNQTTIKPPPTPIPVTPPPVVTVLYSVYNGGSGDTLTLANLAVSQHAAGVISLVNTSTAGQYLWVVVPSSFGTLTSVLDSQASQLVSAFAAQPGLTIAGIAYSAWRIAYPTGDTSNYTLAYTFS